MTRQVKKLFYELVLAVEQGRITPENAAEVFQESQIVHDSIHHFAASHIRSQGVLSVADKQSALADVLWFAGTLLAFLMCPRLISIRC